MGQIPEETKLEILAATDIVDLISSYHIQVKRAGGSFKALCPFHQEKTPSFNISPSKGSYYCFGCGAGGDAIRFVMEYESLPFPEALKKLADRAGITIVEDEFDPEQEKRSKLRRRLVLLHKDITAWMEDLLHRSPIAAGARDYLKSRGIKSEVARRWHLGYAPAKHDLFVEWARSAGYSAREMVASGILSLSDEDRPGRGTYARFKDRLMFPVANQYGDVIAFSGRMLDPHAKTAKYLNSPETLIFEKSKVFYGLDRAYRPITRAGTTVICEGQLDLIACAEAGFENVVAALGTAFTEHHAKTLARYAPAVTLCYDADAAGFKAAGRAFEQLAKANLDVRVAVMPEGEDPDTLIRTQGAGAFQAILEAARPFFDYQIDRAVATLDLNSIRDRVGLANDVAANIAHLSDNIAVDTAILNAATRLKLAPDELRGLVRRKRSGKKSSYSNKTTNTETGASAGAGFTIRDRTVADLCRLAVTDAGAHAWMRTSGYASMLRDLPETDLLLGLLETEVSPEDDRVTSRLLASTAPAEQTYLASLIAAPSPYSGVDGARELLLAIEKEQLQRRLDALQSSLGSGDDTTFQQVIQLKDRLLDISRQLAELAARGR